MRQDLRFLFQAAKMAVKGYNLSKETDPRSFWLGCIGLRQDGAVVKSRNGAAVIGDSDGPKLCLNLGSHAESRAIRKLGQCGTIFVARVRKLDYQMAMALPCKMCQGIIKSHKVQKVCYSIDDNWYGVWHIEKEFHRIYAI